MFFLVFTFVFYFCLFATVHSFVDFVVVVVCGFFPVTIIYYFVYSTMLEKGVMKYRFG